MKICVVGANPAWQKTLSFKELRYNGVNRAHSVECFASGKGINFARASVIAERLDPVILQFSGGANGEMLEEALDVENLHYRSVAIAGETRCCTTCLGESDRSMTELIEPAPLVSKAEFAEFAELLEMEMQTSSMLAVCGTTPGFEPGCDFYGLCGEICRKTGRKMLLDAYMGIEKLLDLESGVVLKINAEELARLTSAETVVEGIKMLCRRNEKLTLAITDGGEPAYLAYSGKLFKYELPKIKVVNPIGSGDSASAIFAGELLVGIAPEKAFASALGAAMANCLTLRCAEFAPAVALELASKIRVSRIE